MSGLRERQKEMRRQAIAKAAVELFESQGFENTTIERIAQVAGVSAPTVFKYFGSKQEIILEMLRAADERAILDTRACLSDFDDPVDALCHLESLLVGYALDVLGAPLWRQLLPLILSGGDGGLPETYRQMNGVLQKQITLVLAELQNAGKLRPDLDIDLAAYLLNDYSHLQLLRLTSRPELDLQGHREQVRRITRLVFEGMRPVNPGISSS
ncbi:TetR/AcrR family transcriptional regulator [Pseudomonas sp. CDFA 602]|uniref:TetR/AcrR family transcriptional regulator n=1 Tax=Pseudomonas californiensis TaxID=2829823 RepID=UPI001E363B2E|nr:TetR/AcrR family transcriptional regulator [Pseudomonas californiensis]MCD5994832.1 TetR/AcrR family transcriptional regulator [Pseudomonas californiensis]MCD6000537.1 TetR/AcrR family transcriptional regulator [Pseudomonas californiensis]